MAGLSSLAEAFRDAEAAIRKVEVFVNKVPVPALNEMRYAGYHAIRYLLAEEHQRAEEISKTISHCRRAYFDAQSFLLLTLYTKVKNIREGLGEFLHFFPKMVGPDYSAKKAAVQEARDFIENLRIIKKDKSRWEKRDEECTACAPHIEACHAYILMFESVREELCCKVDGAKGARNRNIVMALVGALIGVVGTVVAAALF